MNGVNSDMPGIENGTPDPAEDGAGKPREKPRRRGSFVGSLALLLALAALGGTGWMWWQGQTSRGQDETRVLAEIGRLESADSELVREVRQVRQELDGLAAVDARGQIATLERQLAADRARLERAEQSALEAAARARSLQAVADSMQNRLAAVEAAAASPAARPSAEGLELDVAEVDYLLRLASERLQLFQDPAAADRALGLADRQLAALDRPAFYPVRQDIAAARQALAALELPDYVAVAAELDGLQSAVGTLPFRGFDAAPEAAGTEPESGWWGKLKGVFASLVTVRRSDAGDIGQVSLQDKDYVRQRLWLQLEVAQLSLMQRDQAAFRAALGRVRESVDAWFDAEDSRVQAATAALAELAAIPLNADLPDVSAPWSTLRRIRGAAPAAVPAASPAPASPAPEGAEPAASAPVPAETESVPAETGSLPMDAGDTAGGTADEGAAEDEGDDQTGNGEEAG